MKNKDVVSEEFKSAVKKLSLESFTLKLAIKLRSVLIELDKCLASYEVERQIILNKYAKKDAEGKIIPNDVGNATFEEEDGKKFVVEINALLDTEIKVPKIRIKEFDSNTKFTIREAELLELILD